MVEVWISLLTCCSFVQVEVKAAQQVSLYFTSLLLLFYAARGICVPKYVARLAPDSDETDNVCHTACYLSGEGDLL